MAGVFLWVTPLNIWFMEQFLKISSLIKSLEHLINSQRYKDAEKLAKSVLAAAPKHLEVSYLLAIALQGQGNYLLALEQLNSLLGYNPKHFGAIYSKALILLNFNQYFESHKLLELCESLDGQNYWVLINKATALQKLGKNMEALETLKKAALIDPKSITAFLNSSLICLESNMTAAALEFVTKALTIDSSDEMALSIYALSNSVLGNYPEAYKTSLEKAQQCRNPDALCNFALALKNSGYLTEGITLLSRAKIQSPKNTKVYLNSSAILIDLRRYDEAMSDLAEIQDLEKENSSFWMSITLVQRARKQLKDALKSAQKAYSLNETSSATCSNLALVYLDLELFDDAMLWAERSLAFDPKSVSAMLTLSEIAKSRQDYDTAVHHLNSAYSLSPNYDFLLGEIVFTRAQLCDWSKREREIDDIRFGVLGGRKVVSPFVSHSLLNDPSLQLSVAKTWAATRFPILRQPLIKPKDSTCSKITVGYFSPDFREHAVTHLTTGLFAAHNREKFRVIGFSLYGGDSSEARSRISQEFDEFYDLSSSNDADIISTAKSMNLDFAIDLAGYTKHNRFSIFGERVAQIQIGYLGFLGTSGASSHDYLIADKELIQESEINFYSEKILWIPGYQVSGPRPVSPQDRRDGSSGPSINNAQSINLCCLNNSYKLTANVFKIWLKILKENDSCTLSLLEESASQKLNLQNFAEGFGVEKSRLRFFKRMQREDYLKTLGAHDLFLDTSPYNAGTTCSDALWMHLPVLTLRGNTFASRQGASLLSRIGAPDLIAHSEGEYESKLRRLASSKEALITLKLRIKESVEKSSIFDTESFCSSLEAALVNLWTHHQRARITT